MLPGLRMRVGESGVGHCDVRCPHCGAVATGGAFGARSKRVNGKRGFGRDRESPRLAAGHSSTREPQKRGDLGLCPEERARGFVISGGHSSVMISVTTASRTTTSPASSPSMTCSPSTAISQ